jgi:hypothetical protein
VSSAHERTLLPGDAHRSKRTEHARLAEGEARTLRLSHQGEGHDCERKAASLCLPAGDRVGRRNARHHHAQEGEFWEHYEVPGFDQRGSTPSARWSGPTPCPRGGGERAHHHRAGVPEPRPLRRLGPRPRRAGGPPGRARGPVPARHVRHLPRRPLAAARPPRDGDGAQLRLRDRRPHRDPGADVDARGAHRVRHRRDRVELHHAAEEWGEARSPRADNRWPTSASRTPRAATSSASTSSSASARGRGHAPGRPPARHPRHHRRPALRRSHADFQEAGFEIVHETYASWARDQGYAATLNIVGAYPNVDHIHIVSTAMAIGAVEALDEVGRAARSCSTAGAAAPRSSSTCSRATSTPP